MRKVDEYCRNRQETFEGRDGIYLVLQHLRRKRAFKDLAVDYHESNPKHLRDRYKSALSQAVRAVESEFDWCNLSADFFQTHTTPKVKSHIGDNVIVLIVDCTDEDMHCNDVHWRVEAYDAKKKKHAITYLRITTTDGHVVWPGHGQPAKGRHGLNLDATIWHIDKITEVVVLTLTQRVC